MKCDDERSYQISWNESLAAIISCLYSVSYSGPSTDSQTYLRIKYRIDIRNDCLTDIETHQQFDMLVCNLENCIEGSTETYWEKIKNIDIRRSK